MLNFYKPLVYVFAYMSEYRVPGKRSPTLSLLLRSTICRRTNPFLFVSLHAILILDLILIQVAIFSPTLLHLTRLLLPRTIRPDSIPTLPAPLELLDPIRQQLSGDFLILGLRPSCLGFDHEASWMMDDLDGGVGFVLVG